MNPERDKFVGRAYDDGARDQPIVSRGLNFPLSDSRYRHLY